MKTQQLLVLLALAAGCGGSQPVPAAPEAAPASSASATSAAAAPPTTASAPPLAATSAAPAAQPPTKATQISARHVLIQWMGAQHAGSSVVRTRDQARVVAEEVLRRAKAGEDFARLAVEYSDEPGAAARGGSLGRFGHGQMVKAFEDAAFALKPGDISEIIESPFGFHIIQRTE
jgi:NIMA-interacting peptidyl-prolyl cis-trans isomerase 1